MQGVIPEPAMKTITPNLWFDGYAEEAAEFYPVSFPIAGSRGS
jgi:predicted 3-demethylubiquinone-9 3-methyltransferase (glyoxalase superfamily)